MFKHTKKQDCLLQKCELVTNNNGHDPCSEILLGSPSIIIDKDNGYQLS